MTEVSESVSVLRRSHVLLFADCRTPGVSNIVAIILAMHALTIGYLGTWDIDFPDSNGQLLWRVCSVAVTVALAVIFVLCVSHEGHYQRLFEVCCVLYIVARCVFFYSLIYSFHSFPVDQCITENDGLLDFIPFWH